ncbi:MAG: dicarboxylate/amino acid:cation symporter [Chitinispirillia bacterium]|nr:dicarboxylate/amino acid:cation symporter [Chitinispirillia bacterium]
MIILEKELCLKDEAAIDEASEQLAQMLGNEGVDRRQVMRIRLSAEEVFLRWRDTGAAGVCTVYIEKKFGGIQLEIVKEGAYNDPFDARYDADTFSRNLMANLGVAFKFNYWRNYNSVSLLIKKKQAGLLVPLIGAIALAVALGMFLNSVFPQAALSLQDSVLTPLFDCFVGLLTAIVGPAMFLSVLCGLCSVGDTAMLGKMGKALFGRLLLMNFFSAVVVGIIMFFTITLSPIESAGNTGQAAAILGILLGIVPSNFVNAFLSGNALQIIFMALAAGTVLMMLRTATYNLMTVVEQCNSVFQTVLEVVSAVIPFFVFINVLRLVLSNEIFKFGGIWWLFAVFFGAIAVWAVLQIIEITLRERVSPLMVFRKMSATFLINITTASSATSFPASLECCEKKFGIHKKLVKIGLPLGTVIFKPATVVYFSALSIFCAGIYDVPITLASFITVLVVSIILSIAVPPVVGGNLTCYTLLFLQLGIPLEALSVAIAVDVVLDFFVTSFDISLLQTQLLHASHKMGLLDNKVLKKVC